MEKSSEIDVSISHQSEASITLTSSKTEETKTLEEIKYQEGWMNSTILCFNEEGNIDMKVTERHPEDLEVEVSIHNLHQQNCQFWIDLSPLICRLIDSKINYCAIFMIIFQDSEPCYRFANELMYCPQKCFVKAEESLKIWLKYIDSEDTNADINLQAMNNIKSTLSLVMNASHDEFTNIFSKFILVLSECYKSKFDGEFKDRNQNQDFSKFYDFIIQEPDVIQSIEAIFKMNTLGPIVFVTCELAPWFKIGGLAIMVDELTRGLAKLNQDIVVIVPYYQYKKDTKDIVELDPEGIYGIEHIFNINVNLGGLNEDFGIHYGEVKGVKIYFIHHSEHFYEPYPGNDKYSSLRSCTLFCKASLQLLCDLRLIPELIVTNDWFCAFTAGYANDHRHFRTVFDNTTFMHIFHNLDINYEGRFYMSKGDTAEHIHCLPNDWLIDPFWNDTIINPSRIALMTSDQWSTVSKSYLKQVKEESPLSPLLNRFPKPFACSNGVSVIDRLNDLRNGLRDKNLDENDHSQSKRYILNKYLNIQDFDQDICLFSFIGRFTLQKGIDLICNIAEDFINKHSQRVAIVIGGSPLKGDKYGEEVYEDCQKLMQKLPNNFYAGLKVTIEDPCALRFGSDFCLMPSRFEPGGIVQHEYFVASTPAVVHSTGGLKDSVTEYDIQTGRGNGYLFTKFDEESFTEAVEKAFNAFKNPDIYQNLRQNAFNSVIDLADVSRQWCSEFYRVRGKIYFEQIVGTKECE